MTECVCDNDFEGSFSLTPTLSSKSPAPAADLVSQEERRRKEGERAKQKPQTRVKLQGRLQPSLAFLPRCVCEREKCCFKMFISR